MLSIAISEQQLEVDLAAGALACPDCGGRLPRWGFARSREVRMRHGVRSVRPRRALCACCDTTHVLCPAWSVPGRRDGAEVIGEALRLDGRYECSECHERTSTTAGTIFDRTRTPLTVWLTACWLFATQKDGISALALKRTLQIGSTQTAWAMLHRLRSVLLRPGRERLQGLVEVDETYIGGEEPGLRGGRRKGKKVLVGVAVERRDPKGFGRCRIGPIIDASAETLRAFLLENVEPGAKVITDGWGSYPGATKGLYVHEPLKGASGRDAPKLLPGVHTVSSLAKRWLLGTHQGALDEAHLASYLNEFEFRFNRCRSRSRGMVFYRVLELAVAHQPVRYTS